MATATTHCLSTLFLFVHISFHHVACTATTTTTKLASFICWNLICVAVISYFHGKLSKHSFHSRLLSTNCRETLFSGLLFRHCHKSFGKTFKTVFFCCLEIAKVLKSQNWLKQIVSNSNNIFPPKTINVQLLSCINVSIKVPGGTGSSFHVSSF